MRLGLQKLSSILILGHGPIIVPGGDKFLRQEYVASLDSWHTMVDLFGILTLRSERTVE